MIFAFFMSNAEVLDWWFLSKKVPLWWYKVFINLFTRLNEFPYFVKPYLNFFWVFNYNLNFNFNIFHISHSTKKAPVWRFFGVCRSRIKFDVLLGYGDFFSNFFKNMRPFGHSNQALSGRSARPRTVARRELPEGIPSLRSEFGDPPYGGGNKVLVTANLK